MCWCTVLLEDVSVTMVMAPVNEKMISSLASVQYRDNMQRYKSFISHILSLSFEVNLTALLAEHIGQNGPETTS